MNTVTTIQIVTFIVSIVIHFYIIYWLTKMNSCKCSSSFSEKKYLYEWFIFMVIWLIIYFIIILSYEGIAPAPMVMLGTVFGFINLIMIIRLFIYLRKLRETKCNCGTLREINIIYYYLIFVFSILAFFIFISIIASIYTGFSLPAKASKTLSAKSNKNKSLK